MQKLIMYSESPILNVTWVKFPLSRYNLVTKTSGKLSSKNQLWIKETRFAFKSAMSFLLDQRGKINLLNVSWMDLRGGQSLILGKLLWEPDVLILLIKAAELVCYCFCNKLNQLSIIMMKAYCFTILEVKSLKWVHRAAVLLRVLAQNSFFLPFPVFGSWSLPPASQPVE